MNMNEANDYYLKAIQNLIIGDIHNNIYEQLLFEEINATTKELLKQSIMTTMRTAGFIGLITCGWLVSIADSDSVLEAIVKIHFCNEPASRPREFVIYIGEVSVEITEA